MRMKLLRAKALKSRAYGDWQQSAICARASSARIIAPDRRICAGHGMHVGIRIGGNHLAGFVLMTEHGEFSGRRMQCFEQRPRLPIQIPINRLRKIFRHDSHSLVFAVFA